MLDMTPEIKEKTQAEIQEENRRRFVQHLRTTKKCQGTGALHYKDTYCAIGIFFAHEEIPIRDPHDAYFKFTRLTGIHYQDMFRLNDYEFKTFSQIADHIEEKDMVRGR